MEALPRSLRAWFQYNMDLHDENARQNDRNDALPQKKPPQNIQYSNQDSNRPALKFVSHPIALPPQPSPKSPPCSTHTQNDVERIQEELRKLGITNKIPYKADEDTLKGKYRITGHRRINKYYE